MSEVVVTGIGVVCAGGTSTEEYWRSLCSGATAIGPVTEIDKRWLGNVLGGEVKDLNILVKGLSFDASAYNRTTQLALLAASEALTQARLLEAPRPMSRGRIGVVLGTCQGSMPDVAGQGRGASQTAMHGPVDAVATEFDLGGYRAAISTACTASANAIAMARHLLLREEVDVVLAGGADALSFFILALFTSLLSVDSQPCSPYDRSAGLNVGDGAAILVMERSCDAQNRGVDALAKIAGVGRSSDAYHMAAPDPAGRGALSATQRALAQAGLSAADVDYVNGHGTGTSANDKMELRVMRTLFASDATPPPISSVKGHIGHTLGAAGAIEAAACILAIRDGAVPPTANVDPTGRIAEGEVDIVAGSMRQAKVDVALSNNFAFGGSNTSVVVVRPDVVTREVTRVKEPAVITGVGAVSCLGIGLDQWLEGISSGRPVISPFESFDVSGLSCRVGGEVPTLDNLGLAPPAVWRRMDALGRLCLASTDQALHDAGLTASSREEEIGILFATSAGSLDTFEKFWQSAEGGWSTINPLLVPQTSLNAAAGQVSIARCLRGPTSTITTGNLSGALAVAEAVRMIELGECERIVVVSGDLVIRSTILGAEDGGCVLSPSGVVRPFDASADGSALSASSVALLIESASSARRRQRRPHCELAGFSIATSDDTSEGPKLPWVETMCSALDEAGVAGNAVDYCVADAPGVPDVDLEEAIALHATVGPEVMVGAPKSIVGHTMASDLLTGAVMGILAIEHSIVAPTVGLEAPSGPRLNHVIRPLDGVSVGSVLVNSAALNGMSATFVLKAATE